MTIELVGVIQSGQAATRTLTYTDTLLNTAASGLHRCVICAISNFAPADGAARTRVESVTYDGVEMTPLVQINSSSGSSAHGALFGILDADLPSVGGGYAVVITTPTTGSNYICACTLEFTGVLGFGVTGYQQQPNGSNNDHPTVAVTSTVANSMLVDVVSANDILTGTVTGSTGQTSRYQFNDAVSRSLLNSTCLTTTVGSYTMSWLESLVPPRQAMVVAELTPYVPPSDTSPLMWAGSEF